MSKPFAALDFPGASDLNLLVGILDKATTEIDAQSTAAETTIYSEVIPAGAMSTDRMLRLFLMGDALNNTGADRTFIVKVKFGGTTIMDSTSAGWGIATSTGRRAWSLDLHLANLNSAAVQFMSGNLKMSGSAGNTTGIGRIGDAPGSTSGIQSFTQWTANEFASNGTHALDTSVAQTLEVTVQPSTSSASLSFRRKYGVLELL